MNVRFSHRAQRRAAIVAAWWRANRPAAPDLFLEELEEAKRRLTDQPHPGLVYETMRGRVMHRMLLRKSNQHVYYTVDETARVVTVQTIWGARRGRGPKL